MDSDNQGAKPISRAIWPDLSDILSGDPIRAPFWAILESAKQAITVVEGLNVTASEQISAILEKNENLRWQAYRMMY